MDFFLTFKISLTQADMDDLNSYPQVFEGIAGHVHAASHKIALLTGEIMRPYGFIMKATLEDNLPSKGWERETVIKIRLFLQVHKFETKCRVVDSIDSWDKRPCT